MIPFVVVVRDELADGATQRALADPDHALEAGVLDGAHEALRVGVQVRRAGGASDGGDIGRGERVAPGRTSTVKRVRPRGVQTSTVKQSAAARTSQWAARHSRQVVRFLRSGAGSRPRSLRTLARVPRAT